MTKPLNITQQECACLLRMVSKFKDQMTTNQEWVCKPFIEHLQNKLSDMTFPQEQERDTVKKMKSA